MVENLVKQIDKNPVYENITEKLLNAAIIIPPDSDAVYNAKSHPQRNKNLQDIRKFGRIQWQKIQAYGNRNVSELAIQRYKKLLGNSCMREK